MSVSHPAVHPVIAPPPTTVGENVPARVRMNNVQGMPGTIGGLALRFFQFIFAAASLCIMATTSDFPSVTAFRYLVAATGLQCLWSFLLAMIDLHALLVGRTLQNYFVVSLFAFGDGITSTLTYAAACSSAGITVLIGNDLGICGHNHCAQFESATALAFLSWFAALPSFLFNFWSLASPSKQQQQPKSMIFSSPAPANPSTLKSQLDDRQRLGCCCCCTSLFCRN